MPVTASDDDPWVVGNTHRVEVAVLKDGEVWDLTFATVQFLLRKPSGTLLTKTMTVSDADAGLAYYDTLTTDLDEAGDWALAFRVTEGTVVQKSGTVLRSVVDSPTL